ncbi:putative nuclease HARBI1 [Corythoichthys intestinalis]|uniref:putative nuclease HARBI1 n=1 Tax=Corythoichthys intestinalis TaxID=161448 RepID=UPI0025A629AA|nr:putative nuclease HARBI1 [Corythoichthys intestinalis]XP_061807354.1 putative nuclease HARBI1 [Nerophis lumbriciformis]
MACPFLSDPIDIGAQIIRNALRGERLVQPQLDLLAFPEEILIERYHFSSNSILYLHSLLRPYISNLTHRGGALTSMQILCIGLRFFAHGSFLYNIGGAENIGKSTVCRAVRKVTLALKRVLPVMVVFPGHKPVEVIKEEFQRIAGFPNVIGCVDATHIPITPPAQNERDYLNQKSFHSINVQIICDASYKITNLEARWPGSVDDSHIYEECSVYNKFAHGHFDGYLLGDVGYQCQPTLITPYPDPEPGPQQRFNEAHSRTRARIGMTINMLKSRFQCLQKLRVTPERACDIIVACVVLHNIATNRGEEYPVLQMIDTEEEYPFYFEDLKDGMAARDRICRNCFSDEQTVK